MGRCKKATLSRRKCLQRANEVNGNRREAKALENEKSALGLDVECPPSPPTEVKREVEMDDTGHEDYEEYEDGGGDDDSNSILERVEELEEASAKILLLKPCEGFSRCLLCYQKMDSNLKPVLTDNIAEENLHAMFILQKILQVPKDKLAAYLRTLGGSPCDWIAVCRGCLTLVEEALNMHQNINRLEERLRKCQEEMVDTIKSTWKYEQLAKSALLDKSKFQTLRVTNELRHFVCSRDLSVFTSGQKEEDSKNRKPASHSHERTMKRAYKVESSSDTPLSTDSDESDSDSLSAHDDPLPQWSPEKSENPGSTLQVRPPTSVRRNRNKKKYVVTISSGSTATTSTKNDDKASESINPVVVECPFEEHSTEGHPYASYESSPEDSLPLPESETQRDDITADLYSLSKGNYMCSLCPATEGMSLQVLICHIMFHFRRPFKCSQCNLYFACTSELEKNPFAKAKVGNHTCSDLSLVRTSFEPGKVWECAKCSEKFCQDTERDSHEKSHSTADTIYVVELKHKCESCPKQFRNLGEWLLHRALDHPQVAVLSCLFCEKSFISQTKEGIDILNVQEMNCHIRKSHASFHMQGMPNICDFCGAMFEKTKLLNCHMEEKHALNRYSSYSCNVCYARREGRRPLLVHLINVHNLRVDDDDTLSCKQEELICDRCGYKVRDKLKFVEHKFSKHGTEPDDKFARKFHKCTKEGCGFRTLLKGALARHMMKEHKAARRHVCQTCGKGFLTGNHLRRHEQIHDNAGVRPYQCEICGNSFAVQNYLYIHMRLSHQNRPFASTHKKKPYRSRKRKKQSIASATTGNDYHVGNSSSTITAFNFMEDGGDGGGGGLGRGYDNSNTDDTLQQVDQETSEMNEVNPLPQSIIAKHGVRSQSILSTNESYANFTIL